MADPLYNYQEVPATRAMRTLPRFGHSSEFAYLFSSDKEQQTDYIVGLLFAGVFILCFFFVWSFVELVLKCLGKRNVGYFSGSAMEASYNSRKPLIIRIVFLLATITLVIFSVLIVTEGLTNLYNTADTVWLSAKEVDSVINDANAAAISLNNIGETARALRDVVVLNLDDGFCPGVDLSVATGIDFDTASQQVRQDLIGLGDFYQDEITQVQEGLDVASDTSKTVVETSENIQANDWQSLIIIIPFVMFAFFITIGVVLAWIDKDVKPYQCFLSWIVLPLFIIMIVVCYLAAGGIAIAGSANADFCSGGETNTPDETVLNILAVNGYTEEDIEYRIVDFYVSLCQLVSPWDFLDEFSNLLNTTVTELEQFNASVSDATIERLDELCPENIASLWNLTETLLGQALELGSLAENILSIVACDRLLPIYTNTFYDGTCTYSISGVTWTFSSFLVIATMGMFMIMFRTAWLPTVYTAGKNLEYNMPMDEGQEVEYTPYQPGQTMTGSWDEHTEDKQAPPDYSPEISTGVVAGAAAGAAVGTMAAMSMQQSSSGSPEVRASPQSNDFSSGHEDHWLNIDDGRAMSP